MVLLKKNIFGTSDLVVFSRVSKYLNLRTMFPKRQKAPSYSGSFWNGDEKNKQTTRLNTDLMTFSCVDVLRKACPRTMYRLAETTA